MLLSWKLTQIVKASLKGSSEKHNAKGKSTGGVKGRALLLSFTAKSALTDPIACTHESDRYIH